MPSTFDAMFAAVAAPNLLAQFGEQVTYTPRGGEAITLTAMVNRGDTRDATDERGRKRRKTWEITVPSTTTAAAGTTTEQYVADPHQAATVTIDSEEFHVSRVLSEGPLSTLEITNAAAREATMPHMRK